MIRLILTLLVSLSATAAAAAEPGLFDLTWKEVARDVFVGGREDPLRYPVVANTTIVIGKRGVLVFDGGGFASQGDEVLAKIRAETKKPVAFLVISHWHGDHHRGAHPIIEAFPAAEIIAHRFTCAAMADGPERRVEAGEADLGETYKAVAGAVESGKWFDGSTLSEEEMRYFSTMLADYPAYSAELAKMRVMVPTRAVDETTTIDLGGRNAVLLHAGLGNTAGDLALYLPKEKMLATGDIVVAPVPYGFGSYPGSWVRVIRQLAALPVTTIVPGHGAIMTDRSYLDLMAALLDHVADAAAAAAEKDRSAEIDFSAHEPAFTGNDPVKARLFDMFFKQPIVSAAANEAAGAPEKNEPLDADVASLCKAANADG